MEFDDEDELMDVDEAPVLQGSPYRRRFRRPSQQFEKMSPISEAQVENVPNISDDEKENTPNNN